MCEPQGIKAPKDVAADAIHAMDHHLQHARAAAIVHTIQQNRPIDVKCAVGRSESWVRVKRDVNKRQSQQLCPISTNMFMYVYV